MSSFWFQADLKELKGSSVENLRLRYYEVLGFTAPYTLSKKWLYHNIGYAMYEEYEGELPPEARKQAIAWADKLTPEEELEMKFKKLTAKELKKLCETHDVKYDERDKEKTISALVNEMCEVEEIFGSSPTPVQRDRKTRNKSQARKGAKSSGSKRVAKDDLPGTVPELLKLKEGASKDMQRRIRQKLRSIDKDWKKNYAK
jgi:hypothetical protein